MSNTNMELNTVLKEMGVGTSHPFLMVNARVKLWTATKRTHRETSEQVDLLYTAESVYPLERLSQINQVRRSLMRWLDHRCLFKDAYGNYFFASNNKEEIKYTLKKFESDFQKEKDAILLDYEIEVSNHQTQFGDTEGYLPLEVVAEKFDFNSQIGVLMFQDDEEKEKFQSSFEQSLIKSLHEALQAYCSQADKQGDFNSNVRKTTIDNLESTVDKLKEASPHSTLIDRVYKAYLKGKENPIILKRMAISSANIEAIAKGDNSLVENEITESPQEVVEVLEVEAMEIATIETPVVEKVVEPVPEPEEIDSLDFFPIPEATQETFQSQLPSVEAKAVEEIDSVLEVNEVEEFSSKLESVNNAVVDLFGQTSLF